MFKVLNAIRSYSEPGPILCAMSDEDAICVGLNLTVEGNEIVINEPTAIRTTAIHHNYVRKEDGWVRSSNDVYRDDSFKPVLDEEAAAVVNNFLLHVIGQGKFVDCIEAVSAFKENYGRK